MFQVLLALVAVAVIAWAIKVTYDYGVQEGKLNKKRKKR